MSFIQKLLIIIACVVGSSWADMESYFSDLTITTKPASDSGISQDQYLPVRYGGGKLPFVDTGYYSLEGIIHVDSSIEDPALFIGSSTYPITIVINGEEVYKWGKGHKSRHFADYRSHAVGIPHNWKGDLSFRADFWHTGESFALATMKVGERVDMQNEATFVSFFNIHLLNGILISAVFAAMLFGGYFIISGMKEPEILYFSLFSITLVLSLIIFPLNSQQFYEIPLFKFARIGTLFLPFMMLQFVRNYAVVWDRSRLLFWIPLGATILMAILILFAGHGKVGINEVFNGAGNILILGEFLVVLLILIRAFIGTKNMEIALIFVGFLAFILMVVHDLNYLNSKTLPQFWTISYGYLLISFTMLGALILRQRKAYQDLLFLRVELLEANRKVALESENREAFIRNIAHELRTPLHAMDGGVRSLRDELQECQLEELVEQCGVPTALHRLKITLSNIFSYVEAENSILRIVKHSFSIREMLEELQTHFSTLAEEKGISFSLLYGTEDMPEIYRGDRDHLQLVFANIMFNALKYTSKGGVTCKVSYHNEQLIMSVADTGCGMAKNQKEALFASFKRSEEFSFSQRYEGVGLGLSISDSIIRSMQGEITLESSINHGTTVIVSVPLKAVYEKPDINLQDYTILIVDDIKMNCQILAKMVEKMGASTAVAFNGEEAVRYQKKHRYDLVLMDVQMPVMDGLKATETIREFDKETPIIAVTANAEYHTCLAVGMNDHLAKPVNYEHLYELLTSYLNV